MGVMRIHKIIKKVYLSNENKEKVIIFVTAGIWQLNGIKIAKQGFEILSIDSDPFAEGFKYQNIK